MTLPHRQMTKLADVKTALAEKYTRLTRIRKSKGAQDRAARQAEIYRRQAASLRQQARP